MFDINHLESLETPENGKYERLLRLADKLEGKGPYEKYGPIPDQHFDINSWFYASNFYEKTGNQVIEEITNYRCGTSACAVGWACLDPWFNERGLKSIDKCGQPCPFVENTSHDLPLFMLADFFDISHYDVADLFLMNRYLKSPKPYEVARRIRNLVDGLVQKE